MKELHSVQWVNRWPFTFSMWAPGEPTFDPLKRCGWMNGTTFKWQMRNCNDAAFALCMDPVSLGATPPATIAPDAGGTCPPGWFATGGFCYLFNLTQAVSYSRAFLECQQRGSTPASISSAAENQLVLRELRARWNALPPGAQQMRELQRAWIGFTVRANLVSAVDGSPVVHLNWDEGEPSAPDAALRYCSLMRLRSGKWATEACHDGELRAGFVCRRPKQLWSPTSTASSSTTTPPEAPRSTRPTRMPYRSTSNTQCKQI